MYITYGCCQVGYAACYVNYTGHSQKLHLNIQDGAPKVVTPGLVTNVTVQIDETNDSYIQGTGRLYYRFNGGSFQQTSLTHLSGDLYKGTIPAGSCGDTVDFYVSAQGSTYGLVVDPFQAPYIPYTAPVRYSFSVFADSFDNDQGWTVFNAPGLTDGSWVRGVPAGGGSQGDPPYDYEGTGKCYVTGNSPGSSVRGGYTYLVSPTLNLTAGVDTYVTYELWYTNGGSYNFFNVSVSNDDGVNWTTADSIGPQTSTGWKFHSILIGNSLPPTNKTRIRFEISNINPGAIVEGGIDAVHVYAIDCRQAPYVAHDPYPGNRTVGIPLNADITWLGGDPNPSELPRYDVYFGTTNPPTIKVSANQTTLTFDPGTMTLWTNYYWRIVAWDETHTFPAVRGPVWTFRAVDPIFPEWRNQGQSSGSIQPGGSIVLSSQGRDNIGVDFAFLSTNETGVWLSYDGAGWWNSDWDYSKRIVIDHDMVAADQTNFPVILPLTSSDFTAHAQPDGDDFVFVSADNSTVYTHEIESYNSATGELVVWVKLPLLSASQDTILYMYYGNPDCGNQQNSAGTWNNGFIEVQHMTGASMILLKDSTANHWDITSQGGAPGFNQPGKVGQSVSFNGNSDYLQASGFALPTDSSYTGSAWVYVNGNQGSRRYAFEAMNDYSLSLLVWYNETFKNFIHTSAGTSVCYSLTTVNVNNPHWYYVTTRADAATNNLDIFINGGFQIRTAFTGTINPSQGLNIGTYRYADDYWMKGKIDEIRLSNVVRSDSWIQTEYNNMVSPSAFIMLGAEHWRTGGSLYGSPHNFNAGPSEWVWSNFTLQNPTLPLGAKIGWKITYVDYERNPTSTPIMSFVIGSRLQLTGNCRYSNMAPVNNVNVQIINIATGQKWQADTNNNQYTLTLTPGVDVSAGQTLRYIARDLDESVNVTDHIVTTGEINAGAINLDLVLRIHYRDLKCFPFYQMQIDSGAAVMKMMMDYLMWNKTTDPLGPPDVYSEQTLYNTYSGGNYLNGDELTSGLNAEVQIQDQHQWIYGYFFSPVANTDATEVLKSICLWLDYNVSDPYMQGWTQNIWPKPGHPYHVPIAIPTGGNYNNWMVVRGIHTNRSSWENYQLNFPITVYGFWLNDPEQNGIGESTYVTVSYFLNNYFQRITIPGDTYYNKYVAITDPNPLQPQVDVSRLQIQLAQSRAGFTGDEAKQVSLAQHSISSSVIKDKANKILIKTAQDSVHRILRCDPTNLDQTFTEAKFLGVVYNQVRCTVSFIHQNGMRFDVQIHLPDGVFEQLVIR
jgi:hypothetical protein